MTFLKHHIYNSYNVSVFYWVSKWGFCGSGCQIIMWQSVLYLHLWLEGFLQWAYSEWLSNISHILYALFFFFFNSFISARIVFIVFYSSWLIFISLYWLLWGSVIYLFIGGVSQLLTFRQLYFLNCPFQLKASEQPINFPSLVCKGKIWSNVWTVRGVPAGAEIEGSRNINRTGMAEEKNADEGMLESLYFPCFHGLFSFYTSYSKDLCAFVVM